VNASAQAIAGSYATGTDFVPETGLYVLHRGEAVTPASENRGGGGGRPTEQTINLVVDGQTLASITNRVNADNRL
jgi:hypothetical protein